MTITLRRRKAPENLRKKPATKSTPVSAFIGFIDPHETYIEEQIRDGARVRITEKMKKATAPKDGVKKIIVTRKTTRTTKVVNKPIESIVDFKKIDVKAYTHTLKGQTKDV